MKKFPFYFLTLFIFCSSLCLAQTENNSPLMMMRPGGEPHEGADPHESALQNPQKERREEEGQKSDQTTQEERDSVFHVSELREALPSSNETTQNDEAAFRDFKNGQIELITSKIDFLKANHPDQTDLISLLESYLQKYEAILELRTFDQWRTDALSQEQQKVTAEQQLSLKPDDATKAQQSVLNLLTCEHEMLNALLAEPVQLERAQAYSRIRSIYALSKDAFENARRLLEQKSDYDTTLNEHIKAEIEYLCAKKAYRTKLEEEKCCHPFNRKAAKDARLALYNLGIPKKRAFEASEEKLKILYGSLEKAKQLQKQSLIASDAMAKSGSFFQQKATASEHLLTQCSEQEETSCYHHYATTLDLLAQDHLSLAQAITGENTAIVDYTKKLIYFAKHAKLAFEHQLSTLQKIKSREVTQPLRDSYQKSFHLLKEAGQCFLSGYQLLKDQGPSTPDDQSQNSYHRGLNLMNTAFVFQLPLIPHKQADPRYSDYLRTIKEAQQHAEHVIQIAPHKEEHLYHAKIASFLYEKITALNHYFQTNDLKATYLTESPKPQYLGYNPIPQLPRNQTPTFYFIEQTASRFLESSNLFQKLSQLSPSQLELPKTEQLIKAAVEKKSQASRLLLQTKALVFPTSAALVANQNQDLH
ncbi:MAG: hypothetical protein K2W97_09340 [Chthoniobacterales bacterium]|nr:hypothetical protein [Chthoniobacterales bacterium]